MKRFYYLIKRLQHLKGHVKPNFNKCYIDNDGKNFKDFIITNGNLERVFILENTLQHNIAAMILTNFIKWSKSGL